MSHQQGNHQNPLSLSDLKFGKAPGTHKPTVRAKLPSVGRPRRPSYYTGRRADIVSMIPAGTESILEVGCAAGCTGKLLRDRGIEYLVGIDINPDLAPLSRQYYSRLLVGDAEKLDLSWIPPESIDCLLYPDVLEHFRDPWAVLETHLKLLKKGGHVVASIPNVRYYKAVRELVVHGAWQYEDAGIFDRGHLRFFTLKSIRELFHNSGCSILTIQQNARGSHVLRFLNRIVLNRLQPFLVKQYRVLAKKA